MTSYDRNDSWRDRGAPRSSSWGDRSDRGSSSRWRSQPSRTEKLDPVPFTKNFYSEKSSITSMSPDEVKSFREKNEMRIQGREIPKPISEFSDIEFPPEVFQEFKKNNFLRPTPIQAQGWPMALSGRDMVGIAHTGSGKTLSFLLPAMAHARAQPKLRRGDGPIVLVLAPTRELCSQIQQVAEHYAPLFGLRTHAVYVGMSSVPQRNAINRGVEILVATPGRLIDLSESGICPLGRVTFLVLDEADRMLDMGFEPQIKKIIPECHKERQTLMWSATWPKEVRSLAETFMKDYIQVNIGSDSLTANIRITQRVDVVDQYDKRSKLLSLLEKAGKSLIIIFANMKRTCDEIEHELVQRRFNASAIHGEKSQPMRERIISEFKSGRRNILIATDVAARGLDVSGVKMVINFDFPNNCEDYIHRIGRTARGNETQGESHTFFTSADRSNARELVKVLVDSKQEVPRLLMDMQASGDSGDRVDREDHPRADLRGRGGEIIR